MNVYISSRDIARNSLTFYLGRDQGARVVSSALNDVRTLNVDAAIIRGWTNTLRVICSNIIQTSESRPFNAISIYINRMVRLDDE